MPNGRLGTQQPSVRDPALLPTPRRGPFAHLQLPSQHCSLLPEPSQVPCGALPRRRGLRHHTMLDATAPPRGRKLLPELPHRELLHIVVRPCRRGTIVAEGLEAARLKKAQPLLDQGLARPCRERRGAHPAGAEIAHDPPREALGFIASHCHGCHALQEQCKRGLVDQAISFGAAEQDATHSKWGVSQQCSVFRVCDGLRA